jgi:hypothetical protein
MGNVNNVVEVVNSYDDGELKVNVSDLGSWKYLWCVFGGGVMELNGSVELVKFEGWNGLEVVIKEKFKEYKESEIESGNGYYVDDDLNEIEFDWDKVEVDMLNKVKELYGDGEDIMKVLVGGYSVEYDNEFVVIVMK